MGVLFDGPMSPATALIALVRMIDAQIDGMNDDICDEPAGVSFATDEIERGVLQVTVTDDIEGGPDVVFRIRIEEVRA